MKCKRCKRILAEEKEGLQACTKCGLPYNVGGKAEVVDEKKNQELEAEVGSPDTEIEKFEE